MFFGHILFVTSGLYGLISASAIRGTSKNENEVGIDSSLVDSGEVSLSREGRYFYQVSYFGSRLYKLLLFNLCNSLQECQHSNCHFHDHCNINLLPYRFKR